MHHCLQINEILELIFEEVLNQTQNPFPIPDRSSLVALLKTCRSFSVPAMKLLWQDLSTLAPLILTMPTDLVEVEEVGQISMFSPRTVTFRREILPTDWERFDIYAPFVRKIGTISLPERLSVTFMVLDDTIFQELKRRDKILLPNLTKIVASSNDLPTTALLLTSRIHRIKLLMHPSYVSTLSELVNSIPIHAPSLKCLRLCQSTTWKPSDQNLLRPVMADLLDNLDLEEFQCDWFQLSDQMTEALVQMPRLRKMSIFKDMPGLARALHLFPLPAARLKEVSIWTNSTGPSPLPHILVSLRPSRLEVFRLQSAPQARKMPCTQEELNGLISAIGTHCSPNFFNHFHLEGWRDSSLDAFTIVDAKLLRPLFAFSKLRQCSLDAYPLEFTDAEVKELAMSWPLLEELSFDLSIIPPFPFTTQTTLRCLLWFAIYCRKLRSLSFVFNGIDSFSDTELSMASDNPLSWLSVGYSTIANPDIVAAFFNLVFPSLSLLAWTHAPADEENSKMWEEVETKIQGQPLTL